MQFHRISEQKVSVYRVESSYRISDLFCVHSYNPGEYDPIRPALNMGLQLIYQIKNTTFGGIQGFTRKPSTPWFDDDGNWGGIVHQERNWTYALVYGTGHEVAAGRPVAVCIFNFNLGPNATQGECYVGVHLCP